MKRALTIFLSLSIVIITNGQIIKSIGIKEGISIANQTWFYKSIDLTLKKDYRVGFYSAATLEFIKSKNFWLLTDLGYCQKGSKEKMKNTTDYMPEGDGTYKTYNTKFDYLTLCPLLKILYPSSHFIPYALSGLRLDYQLSYKSDFNLKQIENDFHKAILGINFGAGTEYKIKNFGILIEGQYNFDLTKVMNTPSSANSTGLKINNNAFIISAGIKYNINKPES